MCGESISTVLSFKTNFFELFFFRKASGWLRYGFHLGGRVIMNDEDVVKVAAAAPDAKIFVTHLEGVNHNSVTHEMVRKRAKVAGILDRVFIPEDGEMVEDL